MAHWEENCKSSSADQDLLLSAAKSDILKLTLNVICGAGFGVSLPFKPDSQSVATSDLASLLRDTDTPPQGFHFTFRAVMEYMNRYLNNVVVANMIIPKWIPRMILPFLKKDFLVYDDFKHYLEALVEGAKPDESKNQTHDLLQGIVQSQQKQDGLTDSEIVGNLHIFTVAGHETTATTLRFALVLLAMHHDVQDWLQRSIDEAIQDQSSDPKSWDYAALFPRLIEPLCVMVRSTPLLG